MTKSEGRVFQKSSGPALINCRPDRPARARFLLRTTPSC